MLANSWIISEKCLLNYEQNVTQETLVFFSAIIQHKMPFVILQEDHSLRKDELVTYYSRKGLTGLTTRHFFSVADAAVNRLAALYPTKKRAAYIGGRGLEEIIQNSSYSVTWERPDWAFVSQDKNATYDDYSYLLNLAKHGTKIVAVEDVKITKVGDTYHLGIGSIIDMLEQVSNTEVIWITLPQPLIIGEALTYLRQPKENAIFVAANLSKEIECANRAQMNSVFVGDTVLQEDIGQLKTYTPTYLVENLSGLLR
ncbi:MAG: HAD hydrolase-like protein [Solobacterium sp.]|nr:HAD hydrolase-like protein [Solobacterium sp.]